MLTNFPIIDITNVQHGAGGGGTGANDLMDKVILSLRRGRPILYVQ